MSNTVCENFSPAIFCKNSVKLTFSLKSYTVNQFDEKYFHEIFHSSISFFFPHCVWNTINSEISPHLKIFSSIWHTVQIFSEKVNLTEFLQKIVVGKNYQCATYPQPSVPITIAQFVRSNRHFWPRRVGLIFQVIWSIDNSVRTIRIQPTQSEKRVRLRK